MTKRLTAIAATALLVTSAFLASGIPGASAAPAVPATSAVLTRAQLPMTYTPPQEIISGEGSSDSWCITDLGHSVYSKVALGVCAGAVTQEFWELSQGNDLMEIENPSSGLCFTLAGANGQPDGVQVVLGQCVGASSQIFVWTPSDNPDNWGDPPTASSHVWTDCYITDNHGNCLSINNQNGVLAAYNPINSSYESKYISSEDWAGPSFYTG